MFIIREDGEVIMLCEECAATDINAVYIHPENGKRYCSKCWRFARPNAPIPIDRCSDAIKNTAARSSEGVVWKPENSTMSDKPVVTQIIAGIPVKACGKCNLILAHCVCDKIVTTKSSASVSRELSRCALCKSVSNDGVWVDTELYWCGTCAAEIEDGGGMTTKHIRLKLRGSPNAIEFFHYVCTQIDNDWPWNPKNTAGLTPCKKCGGMLYISAVLEAEDIRKLGQEAGLAKCKVSYFGDVAKCFNGGK